MTSVSVQKIRESNPMRPMMRETTELLDSVRKRAFELFERRGAVPGNEMGDWLQAEKEVFRVPPVELSEVDGEFQVQLAMPGFDEKDIRVAALPDALIVEGEATQQNRRTSGTVHMCEFGESRVFRRIPLPQPVDVDHVSATLDKGVLQVRAPKAQTDKGGKIAA